jgi:GAF domain-containing protein
MTTSRDFFKTICEVNRAFGSTLDQNALLELVVDKAVETMGGKAACLFLADPRKDVFVVMAQKGLSEDYLHTPPKEAKKLVSEIVKEGHLAIHDAGSDPRVTDHAAKKKEGIASMLVVPVMVRGKVVGVLTLYTDTPREFTPEEIEFQRALAEHGGMAIKTAQLFERINSNAKLFLDLAASINSSLDIQHIMNIMTSSIKESFDMKGVSIRLFNKETGTLDLVASAGLSKEFLEKGPVYAGKSVTEVMRGETVVIRDVATDKRIQYPEETVKEGIAAILCVPIRSVEEVIGAMTLSTEDPDREFTKDLVTLANAVAHQGGLAIQNASRYLALEDDKKSLEKDIWSHRQWF